MLEAFLDESGIVRYELFILMLFIRWDKDLTTLRKILFRLHDQRQMLYELILSTGNSHQLSADKFRNMILRDFEANSAEIDALICHLSLEEDDVINMDSLRRILDDVQLMYGM